MTAGPIGRAQGDDLALTARLLDQLDIAFCLYDGDDRVVLWNERYLAFFPEQRAHIRPGIPYAETLVRFFATDLRQADPGELERHVAAAVARHRAQEVPFVFQRDTGRWLKVASLPCPDGGRLRLWRDVTAEHAGASGEIVSPRAVAALDVGYAVFDQDGGFVTANKRYLDLLPAIGDLQQPGATYPMHLARIAAGLTPEGVATLDRLAGRAAPASSIISLPLLVERHDGGWLKLQERIDAAGMLVSMWSDATRQVEADAKIVQLEAYLREAVDAIPHGLLLFDQERLALTNDRLAAIEPTLAARMPPGASLAGYAEWRAGFGEHAAAEVQLGRIRSDRLDEEILDPSGRWLRILSERTPNGDLLILLTDITREKQAEAEFERQREAMHQSEKLTALGSLLAGVAHELNNPLSIVVARSIMLEEQVGEGRAADSIRKIREAAERCGRIVRTFLAMARQRTPAPREIDLNEPIQGALGLVGYALKSGGVQVDLDLARGLPRVAADPDQLVQVFSNLFVNAEQALAQIDALRRIAVTSRAVGNSVVVQVSDNGPGMPEDVRKRIFEPFFTTKPAGSGTGVGLSVSRGIILAHGGTIDVATGPGRGTAFTITMPVRAAVPAGDSRESTAAMPGHGRRLLVVDDEPDIVETVAEILANAGWQIDTADGGRRALELLGERDYDLIISDLRMPDLDGRALFERAKKLHPAAAARFLFLTGDTLSPSAERFLTEARRPHLQKPVAPQELRLAVAEAIAAAPR